MNNIQCCVQCEEPKFPMEQEAGGEVALGWPGCVNPQCICYGEQQSSVAFRDPIQTVKLLQTRINQLRQWITENGGQFVFEDGQH